jgi:hypothetical protein
MADEYLDDELPGRRVNDTELAEMERDRLGHERPNEYVDDTFDVCAEGPGRFHSFSIIDPAGHRCRYCGRRWRDCLR